MGLLSLTRAPRARVRTAHITHLSGCEYTHDLACSGSYADNVIVCYGAVYLCILLWFAYDLRAVLEGFKIKLELLILGCCCVVRFFFFLFKSIMVVTRWLNVIFFLRMS